MVDEVEQSVLNLKAILESRISSEAPIEAEITSWLSRFKAAVEANAGSIVDPENLGNAAVPTAIILACGGLGAIVGGPVGFGAGSVFGHLVTGQMKPGAAAKTLQDNLRTEQDDQQQ